MANQKPFFGIKVSKPGVPVQKATDKQLVVKDNFTSRVWYDNDNPRIIEGQLPSGEYGLRVSKTGFDVTVANVNQLAFASDLGAFVVGYSTTDFVVVSPSVGSDPGVVTYTHNLDTYGLVFVSGTQTNAAGVAVVSELCTNGSSPILVSNFTLDSFDLHYAGDVANTQTYDVTINFMVLTK